VHNTSVDGMVVISAYTLLTPFVHNSDADHDRDADCSQKRELGSTRACSTISLRADGITLPQGHKTTTCCAVLISEALVLGYVRCERAKVRSAPKLWPQV
jgi:hypothetical protein